MSDMDTCCTLGPYWKVHPGQMDAFRETCERFMEKTRAEPDCMFYGWSFGGDEVHCREGYKDAQAILFHLQNVGPLLEEALKIATITRLEVHGPRSELEKLREPMAELNPQLFRLEMGFRR